MADAICKKIERRGLGHLQMRRILTSIAIALVLSALGVSQTRSLSAREIARRSLPSVVVLISRDTEGTAVTLGSGFFVTSRLLVTNRHVIEDAAQVTARLVTSDEREYRIEGSVAIDETNDLVLLKIGAGVGRALPIAGNVRSEIGDTVYVAGNPEGLAGTFSQGIISAFRGSDYIQITAPISAGSSGSPVMNDRGDVIGVATLASREGQNLNFAVPVSKLVSLLNKVSNVRPLVPPISSAGLAFNGLYWSTVRSGGVEFTEWLRFHDDGSVFMTISKPQGVNLNEIFGWLGRDRNPVYAGKYSVSGSRIEFVLYSAGTHEAFSFSGIIQPHSLILAQQLESTGEMAPVEYRFVKVRRRTIQ